MTLTSCLVALLVTLGTDTESISAPILLDFSAEWCGPCKKTRPEVERLKGEGYPVRVIDIDRSPELKNRYKVNSVPTFIVVDGDGEELARSQGATTAKQLAGFYEEAKRKWEAETSEEEGTEPASDDSPERDRDGQEQHRPWETVVRIKVYNHLSKPRASIGYGSGTIIHSTEDESIILTCAHIFHIDEMRQAPSPSKFPLKVKVDLFDGRLSSGKTPQVHTTESDIAAEVIDYNFSGDVGLIRIRPGRKLPFSRVVPPGWAPKDNQKLTTVGCSQGHDATAWSTHVTRTSIRLQTQNGIYEGTECAFPPLQGRSGGGLFTLEGVLAGVCDFNDGPKGEHGLYASPKTIHQLLDKHRLQFCYVGKAGDKARERLLASSRQKRDGSLIASGETSPKTRFQNPETGELPMPSPEVLGVTIPSSEVAEVTRRSRNRPVRQASSTGVWQGLDERRDVERPIVSSGLAFNKSDLSDSEDRTTGLHLAPSASGDLFAAAPDDLEFQDPKSENPKSSVPTFIPWDKK